MGRMISLMSQVPGIERIRTVDANEIAAEVRVDWTGKNGYPADIRMVFTKFSRTMNY